MYKRLLNLRKTKPHAFSFLFSIACMTAAVGISSIYYGITKESTVNIPLIFVLFLILVSCNTVGYFYGIGCSLFSVLCFNFMYVYPYLKSDLKLSNYPLTLINMTLINMTLITISISILSSYLATRFNLAAEREKQLSEFETEKMRANLLRAISHDLRTPLSGILGKCLVYQDNQPTLSEKEKSDIINNIHDDTAWLINMVENLLTITRIRNDDLTIKTSIESVEEVIGESLQRMAKRHPNCEIHARIPDDLIMLPMDAILIEQVTINLLQNALLHSGGTQPIDLIVDDSPECVTFTVRDYGQGIPEDMLNNLFDGTAYTASHTADVKKGTGIGLVICKTIITAHHGTIRGQNHDSGAEFIFTLPKTNEEVIL